MLHQCPMRANSQPVLLGLAVLLAVFTGFVLPGEAGADTIYSYIDEHGIPVWTDNYDNIPERYRAKVKITERSTPPAVHSSSIGSVHQRIASWSKGFTEKLGSVTPEIAGLTPYQSRIATYAGLMALVCLIAMYMSRSQVVKFLVLWVLILLGVGTPVLLYTSQDGAGDLMKTKAVDAAKKQQDRLQQAP